MSDLVEIFKKALRNEVKARAFYRLASEVTQNDETRMLFLELAGFEENHADELVKMAQHVRFDEEWDPEGYLDDLESHTHASVSNHELSAVLNGDMGTVLKIARQMEQDSLVAYQSLAESTDHDTARAYFTKLAEQESGHLIEVERMALALTMRDADRAAL
jgi:rubrerythrin